MRLFYKSNGKGCDNQPSDKKKKPRNKHGTIIRVALVGGIVALGLNFSVVGFAMYQNSVTSESDNLVKSASYAQTIALDGGTQNRVAMKDNYTMPNLALNEHSVTLAPVSEDGYSDDGFCIVTVNDTDGNGQARERRFRTASFSNTETVNFNVLNAANSVKFEPFWGNPENFASYSALEVIDDTITVGAASQVNYNTFTHSDNFANVDSYLYRVGNGNTVKLSALFKVAEAGDNAPVPSKVKIKVTAEETESTVNGSGTNLEGGSTARCVYTRNSTDWGNSTLKFTGEGPVKVTICEDTGAAYTLNLEVVNGNNATTAASANSANIILLNDVSGGLVVDNGKTLYGNGFRVRDTRSHPSGTGGYVTLRGNCTVDNVQFIGYEPTAQVTSGINNQDYAPAVSVTGAANIFRSCFSGGRFAVMVASEGADVHMDESVIDGGAIGNLCLSSGKLTMKDCKTSTSTKGGLKGLGLFVNGTTKLGLNIEGSFEQYNWLKKSDVPSDYRNALSPVYNNSVYAHQYNGEKFEK